MAASSFDFNSIFNLLYLASVAVFMGYGQRIQTLIMLVGVRRKLGRIELFRNTAKGRLMEIIQRHTSNQDEAEQVLKRLIGSFMISPVSLDPAGLVGKLEHVLDTYDDHLKEEVRGLVAGATDVEVNNLTNLLEVSIGLDAMFRVVRHYYLQSKKQGGLLPMAQLQMNLPAIMEQAEAYSSAVEAFATGKPIGDGIGPLVAKQFCGASRAVEIVKDTDVYEDDFEDRRLLVVRARGPGGNVGKQGSAIEKLVQNSGPINFIITVDAALKLEGEENGEVAEGVGAAIGGPGAERYHIEEAATKNHIPLNAVVVKMSSKEAISVMTSEIRRATEKVVCAMFKKLSEPRLVQAAPLLSLV
jgi:hypothetical protein